MDDKMKSRSLLENVEDDLLAISMVPLPSTKYVLLQSVTTGKKFFTIWLKKFTVDGVVRLWTGRVAYKILGFANSVNGAQKALGYTGQLQVFKNHPFVKKSESPTLH